MTVKVVKTKRIPPDGGWGWVVLTSALLVNFLIPGTVKSFGVLFVEFLHVFKASSTAASWMPALCYFLYNSLGPLSSILSTKYSYKTVTLVGGTFAASGMMLSYFANSVSYLYVSYGLMVGIGAGLSFPPTVYIVTAYFERLRGFANGLCISGSAIGTIVLPPFLQYLLDCFGYRGAVLIMGAITLNTLVCGLLYHPVEQHMITVPIEEGIDNEALTLDEPTIQEKRTPIVTIKPETNLQDETNMSQTETKKNLQNLSEFLDHAILHPSKDNPNEEFAKEEKHELGEEIANGNAKWKIDRKNGVAESKETPLERTVQTIVQESTTISIKGPLCQEATQDFEKILKSSRRGSTASSVIVKSNDSKAHPVFTVHSVDENDSAKNLEKFKSNGNSNCCARRSISEASSCSKLEQSSKTKQPFFDLSVLRDPIYLVILISNTTSAISNTNFMILLPSYAISQGFDRHSSALLLSVVSALDLVGRIGGASLSDIDFVPKYYYFVGGLGTSGIALALLPMANSYTMLAFFCALFGLSSGMYIGITTVILADMLGMEKLSSSYGISLFVNGVLQLVGPPVCGVIFESVGSYKPIFLAFGIILILGTALWAVVPLINRANKKQVEAV